MNVCVAGLWHLGTVTAACAAGGGHSVTAYDHDPATIDALADGRPVIFEPGLADLLREGVANQRLHFTADPAAAVRLADVLWVTWDTPVDEDDHADVDTVVSRLPPFLTPEQQTKLGQLEQRHRQRFRRHGFMPPPGPPPRTTRSEGVGSAMGTPNPLYACSNITNGFSKSSASRRAKRAASAPSTTR